MLKSRDLFMISFASVFGVLLAATYLADRFITQLPEDAKICLLYTSPSPRDLSTSRMPSSA